MKKFKQKLIKGLGTFLLAGALFFPKVQAQERVIIDNFSQPNDTTLNYYGSGDVDSNNVVNWEDYNLIQSVQNDMADISGDNQITEQDTTIFGQFLRGEINYLPSHWNKLDSLEKTSWFDEKMIKIDETDTINSWICYEFSIPLAINFHGYESLANEVSEDFPFKFSKNNRFNIPVYPVSTTTRAGTPHAINGVLIGDNPFNFNDWYFLSPSDDNVVNVGDWDMAKNNKVEIDYIWKIKPTNGSGSSSKIITWYLDGNGDAAFLETPYIKHIVPSNPNKDTIPSEITLTSPIDSVFYNSSVNLEYLVKENQTFLDSAYYELNNIKTNIACEAYATDIISAPVDSISGTISLSQEGEYDFVLYANDMAKPQGNESILNRYFVIDKTAPTTSDNVPTGWQNSNFNVALTPSDALSGVASTKYCISSTKDCTHDTEYSSPISISEEGKQYIRYFSTDSAGNNQTIVSKEVKLDKTAPTTSDNVPTGWQNSDFNVALTPSDALSGIISTKYCISSTNNCTPNTEYTSPISISEEGKQYIRYFSKDSAGNNQTIVSKEVKLDKTLPTTSDNVPIGWQNSNFNVALTSNDALSGVASTKYCISSTKDCTPNTEYTSPISISEEGKQYIRYFSTDSAGNNQPVVSKEVKLDKTASEIIASINKIEKTDSAEIAINVLEANPNYARYSYNDSDWVYFSSDTLFKEQLKQGENILNVESEDKATNFSEEEATYNFIPDAVEEPIQNSSLKIYGNPITDYSEIGYSVSKKGKVMLEVYNIQGKKLETLVNEVKVPGNYRSKINGSGYASGIYFYRLTTPKGTETKKALKK